ncbi:rab GTPase-activating protein 1-like [Colossoma macropomum]|uniref:rab GTPase-activating protein 1-like n=1 Tax=Colossoma macropomum TaxID=42526 RepID=UPI0018645D8C|nr:rab GTPase-activating protein 1-like [Colossoma macropomum]
MMEEVSISVVLDAQVMEQMSEEEILARLVSDSLPKHEVPSKKPKLKDTQSDDPLHRYQKENQKLQEASLRLEQENDNLAHRLVTSKIALRNALDQAEDQVEELTKELLKAKQKLLMTEEEKRGKEEEAAQLKEVFRREKDKAEAEIKRTNGVIADYKKICSQLNAKLERQQFEAEEKLAQIKSKVMECQHCRNIFDLEGSVRLDQESTQSSAQDTEKDLLQQQVQQLEKELAQTKLQMVESRCKIQELEHEKGMLVNELQAAKSTWLKKTLGSLLTHSSTSDPQHSSHSTGSGVRRLSWTPWEGRAAHM